MPRLGGAATAYRIAIKDGACPVSTLCFLSGNSVTEFYAIAQELAFIRVSIWCCVLAPYFDGVFEPDGFEHCPGSGFQSWTWTSCPSPQWLS